MKVLPAPPTTGILDLNLHFTGAKGLDANKAKDDPEMKAALQELGQIFGQVGITIGEVTWSDVNSEFQVLEVMENIEDMFGEVFKLFAEAAGPNAAGVDLFFIDHFTGPGATQGWSGGIPGPPLVHGLEGSGVAIALTKLPDSKLSLGMVMAHELGHFLGLFHTGEAVAWLTDPLPDTPDHDASYLMYFAPEGIKLSEWQGRVLRSSPWIKH